MCLLKPCQLVTLFWDQPTPQVPETDNPAPYQTALTLKHRGAVPVLSPAFKPQPHSSRPLTHSASVSSPVQKDNEVCLLMVVTINQQTLAESPSVATTISGARTRQSSHQERQTPALRDTAQLVQSMSGSPTTKLCGPGEVM